MKGTTTYGDISVTMEGTVEECCDFVIALHRRNERAKAVYEVLKEPLQKFGEALTATIHKGKKEEPVYGTQTPNAKEKSICAKCGKKIKPWKGKKEGGAWVHRTCSEGKPVKEKKGKLETLSPEEYEAQYGETVEETLKRQGKK